MTRRAMIVVAGGSSSRFGTEKLMTPIAGKPVISHTVAAVVPSVERCVLVLREDLIEAVAALELGIDLVPGGASRTASEMAGLAAVGGDDWLIGIHDGARPLLPRTLIESLFEEAARVGGAIPVLAPSHPVVSRADLAPVRVARVVQTPQVFAGPVLMKAFVMAAKEEFEGHDTADVVQRFTDQEISAVPGDPANIKITYPGDLEVARLSIEGLSRSEPA